MIKLRSSKRKNHNYTAFLSWEACVGFRIFQRRQTVSQCSWKDYGKYRNSKLCCNAFIFKSLASHPKPKGDIKHSFKTFEKVLIQNLTNIFYFLYNCPFMVCCNLTSFELVLNPHNEGVYSFHFFTSDQY